MLAAIHFTRMYELGCILLFGGWLEICSHSCDHFYYSDRTVGLNLCCQSIALSSSKEDIRARVIFGGLFLVD